VANSWSIPDRSRLVCKIVQTGCAAVHSSGLSLARTIVDWNSRSFGKRSFGQLVFESVDRLPELFEIGSRPPLRIPVGSAGEGALWRETAPIGVPSLGPPENEAGAAAREAGACLCRAGASQTTSVRMRTARKTLCAVWTAIPIRALRYRFVG
jgi:hypothetical protein